MSDKKLDSVMYNLGKAVHVPDNLFPKDRITEAVQKKPVFVKNNFAAAIVTVLVVAVAMSPIGQAVVKTVANVVMTQRVMRLTPEETAEIAESAATFMESDCPKSSEISIGEKISCKTVVYPGTEKEYTVDQDIRALTVEQLLTEEPDWSVPTYLPPSPETKAILTEAVFSHPSNTTYRMASITYQGRLDGTKYSVVFSTTHYSPPRPVEEPRLPVFSDRPAPDIEEVLINGSPATIWSLPLDAPIRYWHLRARFGTGEISVASSLPKDELIKVAESLPELQ